MLFYIRLISEQGTHVVTWKKIWSVKFLEVAVTYLQPRLWTEKYHRTPQPQQQTENQTRHFTNTETRFKPVIRNVRKYIFNFRHKLHD